MANEKTYVYFFTRQDISPEQQVVQTAHVALQLGVMSQRIVEKAAGTPVVPHYVNENVDPKETYFTVIGVRNLVALEAVEEILRRFGFLYEKFFEPDLGQGEFTSIATYPIPESEKGVLNAFNLLTIKR